MVVVEEVGMEEEVVVEGVEVAVVMGEAVEGTEEAVEGTEEAVEEDAIKLYSFIIVFM